MPIPNSRSRPPRILAHELRWGRGGGRQPPSVDWWFLNLTAASVPDVGCVPSPCSLDASIAGFYKLVLLYGCAASVLNAGRVPSPCSLDDSVAGFSTLALPPPCAMQGGASLTVQPLSSKDLYAVCALARCAVRLLCWRQPRFARCSAAVHVQLLSILGVGCSPSPCASLDALPGFYAAGFDCASRVAVLLCVQPLSTFGV